MTKLAEMSQRFFPRGRVVLACLLWTVLLLTTSTLRAHPLEYHLGPLEESSIERVLSSFELLSSALQTGDSLDRAKLSPDAMGITAIVWSVENAVSGMDESRPSESPTLLQALKAAGYPDSPYIVAEWKMEAERVWEAYEVMTSDVDARAVFLELSELEERQADLSDDELIEREAELIRKASMLRTTAGDISSVAPYRERLDRIARGTGN